METINALGRRKSAVARVFVTPGSGKVTINKRAIEEYFPMKTHQQVVVQPLELLEVQDQYDIMINVKGGGFTGQSQAARLGVARALVKIDPEVKPTLRAEGYLTRDARSVERKKPGQPSARAKFQFSKR